MMNKFVKEYNILIAKRLTAILVAVVFVFGTAVIPTGIYGTETETPAAYDQAASVVETAVPEAEQMAADEDSAASDEAVEEPQAEAEEPSAEAEDPVADAEDISTEEIVEELNDLVAADLDSIDEDSYDGFMYQLSDDATKKEVKEMESAIGDLEGSEGQEAEEVISGELYSADSIETIAEVADPEMIESIEPDYIMRAAGTNDSYYAADGWYLDMINAPYVWDKGMFGDGVKVAVLDSGVYEKHPDFENTKFTAEYNAVSNNTSVIDYEGHGTLVTGIIAASYNNGKYLTGVMPNATIIPVKVMSSGSAKLSVIIKGINHAVANGADVINMSLGGVTNSTYLKDACDAAAAKGVILVAAAGNEANDLYYGYANPIEYPASYDSVISVGSVGKTGAHSSSSNYNKYLDVTAPGERIHGPYAYYRNAAYHISNARYSGTSFSTPQVAAMAAMIKQMDPSVDCKGFLRVLAATSADKGAVGYDPYYGYGIMDLAKAYRYMAEDDITMYDVVLSANSFIYDGKVKTPSATVKKAGKTLSQDYYQITYDEGRTNVGTYKVTAEGIGGFIGTAKTSFTINPPLVKDIKAPKRYKKKLTVRWKAMSKSKRNQYANAITGYQVRVAKNKGFTGAKYVKVKGIAKTKATVKGLKKKTTYYVQYRSYKTVGSATYYSKWSSIKKAKTK